MAKLVIGDVNPMKKFSLSFLKKIIFFVFLED